MIDQKNNYKIIEINIRTRGSKFVSAEVRYS
jgi:hypothetical protein